ncbi:type I-E CRISPR-associated protein Cas7/Cse4/CasC [bacterium]|nr:type I-E CRISPR-associated protein Cas7/Cse4/CasC [bacterium]
MFIELHIIQNFAPSNLNRGETGTPKDCEFGGHRRARISSQCLKRSMRRLFDQGNYFTHDQRKLLADRSTRLVDELAKKLPADGRTPEQLFQVAVVCFNACKLKLSASKETPYLVFMGREEVRKMADWASSKWSDLINIASTKEFQDVWNKYADIQPVQENLDSATGKEATELRKTLSKLEKELDQTEEKAIKKHKKALKAAVDNLSDSTTGGKAADLALFGRMIADLPEKNINASCQVAHAISTHKVGVDFDFYTAVDDLQPHEETGAAMMGTVEFNSACFYRYANIDLEQLMENLGGDTDLVNATVEAFVRSSINAVPSGKQNSMAAHNPPSFAMAVVRNSGLWSLANAFVNPANTRGGDLVTNSILKLDEYWGQLTKTYGVDQIKDKSYVSLDEQSQLKYLNGSRVENINELVSRILTAAKGE